MPTLPAATTTIDDNAGPVASGANVCTVIAPVSLNADHMPRVYASVSALLEQHDYSEGAEYVAHHVQDTRKSVIFVGVPIAAPGVVGRKNQSGNSGTSVVDVAAGVSGALTETDGVVKVLRGGTVGTDQILLNLSLDGGRTFVRVRLGVGTSYVVPFVGLTISVGAGTLVADETVLTWHSSGPMWAQADLAIARDNLAAQQKTSRSWIVVGDVSTKAQADEVLNEVNAYATENERDVRARVNVRDRSPYAELSRTQVRMTGAATLTFAEVGATGDTITRSVGSWIADGFVVGDLITVLNTVSNNLVDAVIASLSALVITLDTDDLLDEGPVADVSVVGSPAITFAEVGATGDTVTRSRGSWLDDGFRDGDLFTVGGTASNNFAGATIVTATATVLTLDTQDLTDEAISAFSVTATAGETMAGWVSTMDAAFAAIDDERRIDIGLGRARKISPITGYRFRRPAQWPVSIREYQHDVHIATYRKADGPLGWDLEDADGNTVEYDERTIGGALAGRFTCLRSYANGPAGTFVALSLTRAVEGAKLSRSHNADVAHVACNVGNRAAEDAIGQSLVLNDDGTPDTASVNRIKSRVDSALKQALLEDKGEGPRASAVFWTPDPTTNLSAPGTPWPAVITLNLNGTIEQISTTVRVQ
jgi:hypothetical protein